MGQNLIDKEVFMGQNLTLQKKEINNILNKYGSARIIPTPLKTEEFIDYWKKWLIYLHGMNFKFTDSNIKYQLSLLHSQPTEAIRIIDRSIKSSWMKLYPIKKENPPAEDPDYKVPHYSICMFSEFLITERNINKYKKYEYENVFNKLTEIQRIDLLFEMVDLMVNTRKK